MPTTATPNLEGCLPRSRQATLEPCAAANCSGCHAGCFRPPPFPHRAASAPASAVAELGVVRRRYALAHQNMFTRALLLLTAISMTACMDNSQIQSAQADIRSKFDDLEKQISAISAAQNSVRTINEPLFHGLAEHLDATAIGNAYIIHDMERKQTIGFLFSSRSISVGESIRLGDDVWLVQAAQTFTKPKPPANPTDKEPPFPAYQIGHIQLYVKFGTKGQTAEPVQPSQPR